MDVGDMEMMMLFRSFRQNRITLLLPCIVGDFESAVGLTQSTSLTKAGKIYIKDDLLFVNDVKKGFHIYRYDSTGQPQPVAFINIPGATDIAMRSNTLYINQATDLVTLLYVNNSISLIKRNRNVFPPMLSPEGYYGNITEDEVIVDWQHI